MTKTDQSLKNLSIAAIKRHTIPSFDFQYTAFYDHNNRTGHSWIDDTLAWEDGEQLICSTIVDDKTWTVVTTRRILSCAGAAVLQHALADMQRIHWGDFKGYSKLSYIKDTLHFTDNTHLPIFIETGRASMVMVYGVETLAQLVG